MADKKMRESGIELLRIILMIQIIFLHISEYGGYYDMAMDLGGTTKYSYLAVWLLCRCPVPLLIVLTGYFMANKQVSLQQMVSRFLKTHRVMLFYALGITALCALAGAWGLRIAGLKQIGLLHWLRAFVPFMNRTWFFMTNYLLILFLSPFLNKALGQLSKKEYMVLVWGLFFLLTIWTSLTKIEGINEVISLKKIVQNEEGKSLYMFLFCYILGGFLKKYVPEGQWGPWKWLGLFMLLWVINFSLTCLAPWYEPLYRNSDNPLVILQCICLLLGFRSFHFHSQAINHISKGNIGVYLIHEHYLMRGIIWAQFPFLKTEEFYQSRYYLLIIWLICVGVYAVCNGVEVLRERGFSLCEGLRHRLACKKGK